jgi:hypothetical protein
MKKHDDFGHEYNTHGNLKDAQSYIPERSRLYSLKPISTQNRNREGLISYICRLAEAHSVSPGILIKQEILPSFKERYTIGSRQIYETVNHGTETTVIPIPKPDYKPNINERGFLSFQYIEGLQPLVLVEDLHSLTIPFGAKQTRQNNHLANPLRRWCPKCFQASLDSRVEVYEPLIWLIDAVKICPVHGYPFQNRCPLCGKTQRSMTGKMQVGRCSQCFAWLNQVTPTKPIVDILEGINWQKFVAETISIALTNEDGMISTHLKESIGATVAEWNQSRKPPTDVPTFQAQSSLLEALLCR